MYNRYIPADSAYRPLEDGGALQDGKPLLSSSLLGGFGEKLGWLLGRFHLSDIDGGDVLLLLIVILLCREEEDNLDWIIILGLAVAFGFFRRDTEEEEPSANGSAPPSSNESGLF